MIQIAIVEPQISGNLGAIARAMKNFGFSKLYLVNPICKIDQEAKNRAKHAQDVLKNAKVVKDISKIRSDYFVATTAKTGTDYNINRSPLMPEELVEKCKRLGKKKITILIGREDSGLTNEEISKADFCVTIPTNKKYPTMNISHATTVLMYELSKINGKGVGQDIEPIGNNEKKQLFKQIGDVLGEMKFATQTKLETQKKVWQRVIGKAMLTKRESFVLMGFFKKLK